MKTTRAGISDGVLSMNNNVNHYQQVNYVSGVTDADPHRLVQMLLEGALGKIAIVKGLMQRKEVARKGEIIGQAMSIVTGLRASLNKEAGGEVAENLDNLYDYIECQMLQANIKNDPQLLDEVAALLKEIKSGWDAISPAATAVKKQKPVVAHA